MADAKLKALAQRVVESQEEERARLIGGRLPITSAAGGTRLQASVLVDA